MLIMGNSHGNQSNEEGGEKRSEPGSRGHGQNASTGGKTQSARAGGDSTASGAYKNETGDPGRTPGSAEGVENFEKTGNE